jgi:dUTP pyrophosphatase
MQTVYFKKLNEDAKMPEYKTEFSVGVDLSSIEDVWVLARSTAFIKTGLAVELPNNLEMQIRSRSGLAAKHGVFVLNSPGTIDPDYTGEISIVLANFSDVDFKIEKGDRIAQAVVCEAPLINFMWKDGLKKTDRGSNGFGSTGVK